MTDHWARIKEIFSQALEREPPARQAFVEQACGEDAALRSEVESLLASHDRADGLLEDASARLWHPGLELHMIGQCVGDYRIVREAGRGGTSVVYLAERADAEYQKRVAIKMLRSAGESGEIIQRFLMERQTLAELDHPNIVRLLDGGTSEEGVPYLVMDFVDGEPIDRYCDSHRLCIAERLRLFRLICDAVEYAHRNGVIHRDLKPNNILVTGEGVPRLLDFGIAKLRDPRRFALTTLVTRSGMHAMTPEYASPEQVRGQPVSVATDVYSLGVLLYVLLCGHHPYRTKDRSLLELERLICEEEPVRPSVAVARTDVGLEASAAELTPNGVAAARAQGPAALSRSLHGDLDAIAMKALSKEPQRRYRSASEFSSDIGRCLAGLSVSARRSNLSYRSGKFMVRHRESVAVALIVLASASGLAAWQIQRSRTLLGGIGASESRVISRPSIAVLGFTNSSRRSDTDWLSTALSEMLTTELAAGGQLRTLSGETIARARLELSLPDVASLSPALLKSVRQDLGSDYAVSGSYLDLGPGAGGAIHLDLHLQNTASGETLTSVSEDGSERQLLDLIARAGARLRERFGISDVTPAESAGVAVSMPANADVARLYAEGLAKLRGFDALGARDLLTRAAASDPAYPLTHAALADAWMALGYDANARREAKAALDTGGKLTRESHLLVEGGFYEASKDWEKSIEAYRTLFNFFPDNPQYGLALANAETAAGAGKDAMATLEKLRRLAGEAELDPRIDLAEANAASVLSDNARQMRAAASAAGKARVTGASLLVAAARVQQCRALANIGEAAESNSACKEARQIYEAAGDWAGAARALHAMAELPLNQGNIPLAQSLYEQALAIARRVGDGRGIARELGNLGVVYAEQGQFEQAEQFAEQSLATYRDIGYALGVAGEAGNLAEVLRAQARLGEALSQYRDSLARAREIGSHNLEALDLHDVGDVLADEGDLAGAILQYNEALSIQRQNGERSNYASTLVALGRVKAQQDDAPAARALFEEALSIQTKLGEAGRVAQTQLALAEWMSETNQPAAAIRLVRSAVLGLRSLHKSRDEIAAQALLARLLLRQGEIEAARGAVDAAARLASRASVADRLALALEEARVRAAERDSSAAERIAHQALAEAEADGLVRLQLQASLTLAELQRAGADGAGARTALLRLAETARSKGFGLIAREAAALNARPLAASITPR